MCGVSTSSGACGRSSFLSKRHAYGYAIVGQRASCAEHRVVMTPEQQAIQTNAMRSARLAVEERLRLSTSCPHERLQRLWLEPSSAG
jgi:hypothetical protein